MNLQLCTHLHVCMNLHTFALVGPFLHWSRRESYSVAHYAVAGRLERKRLEDEQRLKAERDLELEREEAARQEAERRTREEEMRQQELLRHHQELQDKLRQGF